jgi:hypothetical protein
VADDRAVGHHEERFGDECAERGQREGDDLPVLAAACRSWETGGALIWGGLCDRIHNHSLIIHK